MPVAAGYSKRSLAEKLGIKPGAAVVAPGAPRNYAKLLEPLPADVSISSRFRGAASFIHRFVRRRAELTADFPRLAKALNDDGTLWVSWPKQSSGVETDLNENVVREIGLAHGLVDVKVCAVDEVWSGLKFVRRLKDRKG